MKISGRDMICCLVLYLALTSVAAIQRLNSIENLQNIGFGQTVPKNSLVLLYWFANTIEMNTNNSLSTSFDPNNGDYGSHYYSNFEGLLDPLPQGHRYYSVGNIHQDSSVELPSYVVNYQRENVQRNMARIIIRVRRSNSGGQSHRIDRVYVTQHFDSAKNGDTRYDPQHTYEISTNLLREIRGLSLEHNQRLLVQRRQIDDAQLNNITRSWGNLAGLGLLLLLVTRTRRSSEQLNFRPQARQNTWNANAKNCIIFVIFLALMFFLLRSLTQMMGRR